MGRRASAASSADGLPGSCRRPWRQVLGTSARPPREASAADPWRTPHSVDSAPAPSVYRARHHHRLRRWGAPASAADSTHHSASNPSSASAPSTRSSPRLVIAGTFSKNTHRGPTSRTTRSSSKKRPLRAPSRPAPLPATEMSWHGKPPATRSTRPRQACPLNVVTSSWISISAGSQPSSRRAANTRRQYGSISTAQTGRCPSSSEPSRPPPAPANRCSSRRVTAQPPAPVALQRRQAAAGWPHARQAQRLAGRGVAWRPKKKRGARTTWGRSRSEEGEEPCARLGCLPLLTTAVRRLSQLAAVDNFGLDACGASASRPWPRGR